jgi:hypothetical protein
MAREHIETAIEQQEANVRHARRLMEKGAISRDTFHEHVGKLSGLKYALRLAKKGRGTGMRKHLLPSPTSTT